MTTSRWSVLTDTSPSGRTLFRCAVCGRITPTPDAVCPGRRCHHAETCDACQGTGVVFGHDALCVDDLCALNGDEHSCGGAVAPCGCQEEEGRSTA